MPSRRQVLAAGCLAMAGGAGCSQIRDAVETDRGEAETAGAPSGETTSDASEATTSDASRFRITVTDGEREVELVTGDHVATVGDVESARNGDGYLIPVTLTDEGTAAFADGLERVGALKDPDSHRIRSYFEGELLYEAGIGANFADSIKQGKWDGEFLFQVSDRETAEKVKDALEGE